jgi:hypothetical protein
VDAEDLETASGVRDTNVNLTVETTETTESGVDRVGTVGSSHHDDIGTSLEAVHEGEKLRDNTTLNLSVGLVTLGGDRVKLVDEDNSRAVLLGLFKGLAKVRLGLSGHLGHDLGTVDEEEEGTGLVGDGTGHESLTGTRGTEHEDTTGRLDTNGLEELGVTEGELNKLTDLGKLV